MLVSGMSLCLRYHNDTAYREIITGSVACQLRPDRRAGQVCYSGDHKAPTISSPFEMAHALARLPPFARNISPGISVPRCQDSAERRSISEIVWRKQQTGDGYRWRQGSDQCRDGPPHWSSGCTGDGFAVGDQVPSDVSPTAGGGALGFLLSFSMPTAWRAVAGPVAGATTLSNAIRDSRQSRQRLGADWP